MPAFNASDLTSLGAVCTHFSACLAALQVQSSVAPSLIFRQLTPREIQIANLVARGLTNAEIGAELWITQNSVKQALKRMFRKLDVSARTEIVAKLRDILRV
jgi:DNA-binding CsgD family transcriptional regulator